MTVNVKDMLKKPAADGSAAPPSDSLSDPLDGSALLDPTGIAQGTPFLMNAPPPPGSDGRDPNYNPLRTAVIAGLPNAITGGDFRKATELTIEVEDDGSVSLSARLDADASILPSHDHIRLDAEIAEELGRTFEKQQGATYMLLGSVRRLGSGDTQAFLRIVDVETAAIMTSGIGSRVTASGNYMKGVEACLKDAWSTAYGDFQKLGER